MGAPYVIWGEEVRLCQFLPFSPLPPLLGAPLQPAALPASPLSLSQGPVLAPTGSTVTAPRLPLGFSFSLRGLIFIPLPFLLFPQLLGPPQPDLTSLCTPLLLASPSASPCCSEPGDVPSSDPQTCTTCEATQPLQRLPRKNLAYTLTNYHIIIIS